MTELRAIISLFLLSSYVKVSKVRNIPLTHNAAFKKNDTKDHLKRSTKIFQLITQFTKDPNKGIVTINIIAT